MKISANRLPILLLALTLLGACSSDKPPYSPEESMAMVALPEGYRLELVASEPDIVDPVAITFDEKNRLYIAETHRFERGVEDNRRNPWVADDYKLTTTAERLEMYK